jgi:hypothetical protein
VLANRHMQTSSQCPLCKMGCESLKHVYFQCPRAMKNWEHLGLAVSRPKCMHHEAPRILASGWSTNVSERGCTFDP